MNKIFTALVCTIAPVICMASDFNYDDDTGVDITDEDWEGPETGVDIDFSGESSGIGSISAENASSHTWTAALYGKEIHISVTDRSISIDTTEDCIIPVYSFATSTVRIIKLNKGLNTLELDSGLYIILGKKYRL